MNPIYVVLCGIALLIAFEIHSMSKILRAIKPALKHLHWGDMYSNDLMDLLKEDDGFNLSIFEFHLMMSNAEKAGLVTHEDIPRSIYNQSVMSRRWSKCDATKNIQS